VDPRLLRYWMYKGVSKSFRTGRLERQLQMVQLSAIRFSCSTILWVRLVSFAAIILCVASQRVFVVVSIYFLIDSVRKHLGTPTYCPFRECSWRLSNIFSWIMNLNYLNLRLTTQGLLLLESVVWKRLYAFYPQFPVTQSVLFQASCSADNDLPTSP